MSEEQVNIEVNGIPLKARKGAMLIEITDAAGIAIPRFCYHKKLSVAANCRMCLVEVEKAPKPLPACATPVMEGMKVYTESPKALAAQKGTMEFLLINHPLDCPICDQGGECELQDMALGYGADVSRFAERKRVVRDKNIGPLIATDMTRCIHCTRCVRFGEEVAGLRELGATGRGESVEIGTYVAHSVGSELSGNVIDLCPVGALTAKPSRYRGRSWEYVQHPAIAPHDSVGSNIFIHTLRGQVMRVVPRENEAINETWISDRDRFSYEGIYSDDRLVRPWVKGEEADWEVALETASKGLREVIAQHGAEAVGFLLSPTATVEELYLAQKLARGLGVANIDHRLRQADFSDQDAAPIFPWLGQELADLEKVGAALLIGSNVRMEQPLAGHRLRKAALAGGRILLINPRDFEFLFPVAAKVIADPAGMVAALVGVALAVAELKGQELPTELAALAGGVSAGETERAIAEHLVNQAPATVLLGNLAVAHPAFAQLRALASFVAACSGAHLGYLPEAANSAGGWLAGALPHRLPGGASAPTVGLDTRSMLEAPRKAYVLLGVEPELDCWDGAAALKALQAAEWVVSLNPFASAASKAYAHVILPVATFAETSGSYVNAEGLWQSFSGASKPFGEARPAWKVLRVLGNLSGVAGFDYVSSEEIRAEAENTCAQVQPDNTLDSGKPLVPFKSEGLHRVAEVPIYAADSLVRRARSLQLSPLAQPVEVRLHPDMARDLGVAEREQVQVRQNGAAIDLPLVLDESVPKGCAWIPAGLYASVALGPAVGPVAIQ
ncbi:MAG: NADH-quinone oxidoreductase subunit NuoG [Candidatus Competibacter sp.]|jgi:NADH-quinone oxidoreductase subunit G|nr:NADH-quinone oxidoreductase subunit NuoG [Candidatus Competibacter sp.]